MGNGSKLLINEHPLQVLPTLATLIGLNEAIFLQQLHYWLENPKVGREYEGRKYVRNSFEEWQKDNFPFWSLPTLKRIVTKLKKDGLINSTGRLNRMPIDRTQWYTIDYDALENRLGDDDMATRKYQNDTMAKCQSDTFSKDQNDTSIVSKRSDTKYQIDTRNNQRLPETTTETNNNEGSNEAPSGSQNLDNPTPSEFPAPDPVYKSLCDYYKLHVNPYQSITQHVADRIRAELDEATPHDWLEYALEAAADQEKHQWSYIQAILDNIKRAGSLEKHKREFNGHKSGKRKSASTTNGAVGQKQKGQGGIPALETYSRYEKRANIATGETYWWDSETGERCDPPPGLS